MRVGQVFQQLDQAGVEFHKQRLQALEGFPDSIEIGADEAVDLWEGGDLSRLRIKPNDSQRPLPLVKEQDLAEMAFFLGQEPSVPLATPQLADGLAKLAEKGFRFFAGQDEIGLYGAYNSLTEPEGFPDHISARFQQTEVQLSSVEQAGLVAEHYLEPGFKARLELEGWQFFDADKKPTSSFELGEEGYIGKEGKT